MSNYNSNYEIAQAISERIGAEPIPFDSVYEICLQIYNELGGEPEQFDSVYEILLGILPLVGGGIASKVIDDHSVVTNKTWSSSKINAEISALAGTANPEVDGKETEDFTFAQELPVSGEEGQQVIIKGENQDTLYKYTSGAWAEQTPDATKLYFDTENEALYSYVTVDHQFAPVSMVNTIVVGSNLNSNAALKALKTPGVYSVVQRLHNATKGDYVKNWTLYVESVDYEEYDKSDSVYQRMVSNYTIQKRTWSATRATNDGWSNFSTYYAGEIKDTTTSKYYTWSSSKIAAEIADAGFDVQIVQELPVSGDAHTIYFVPVSGAIGSDVYNEFMYVDGAWEQVGSTRIDLSNYYTKSETDTLLAGKADVYELATIQEIAALFIPIPTGPANNEIWYVTSTGNIQNPTTPASLPTIVSNTYSDGKGVMKFDSDLVTIRSSAFSSTGTKFTSITLPKSVREIGYRAFNSAKGLLSVELNDGLLTIGEQAFGSAICVSGSMAAQTTLIIPDTVTSIGPKAFQSCYGIHELTIGKNVTSIGQNAFFYCSGIEIVNFTGTMSEWNAITKGQQWNFYWGTTPGMTPPTVVHCSDGDVAL